MKRIITVLLILFYTLISFFIFNVYSYKEIDNVLNKNTYMINLEDINLPPNIVIENSDKYVNKVLDNIAQVEDINIYKPIFKVKGNLTNLHIFSNIGNEEEFINKFKIKFFYEFNNLNNKTYVANTRSKEATQVGIIDILSKNKIYITNMKNMNNEGVSGTYYISNNVPFNKIKNIFNKNGLVISLNNHKTTLNYEAMVSNNRMIVLSIGILSILIAIVYIYYLALKFKKIAIQKIHGYSNTNIFLTYLKELILMNLKAIAIAFILQICFIAISYKFIGINNFITFWIKIIIISFFINVILDSALILFTRHFKIKDMIKNKKPTKIIYIYSLFFKIFVAFILINLIFTSVQIVFQYEKNVKSLNIWNQTQDYVHIEYNQPVNILTKKGQEFVKKNQYLYSLLNSTGILCVQPSIYQNKQKNTENFKGFGTYSLFYGNSILVNSNYLRKNPIYFENGKRVSFKSDYGNYLIILVPEIYKKDQKNVEQALERWYEFKKYSSINLLRQAKHEKLVSGKAPIKIYYIKNNQKTFLYNVNSINQNRNYSYNSVIAILNSKNDGAAEYLSYITMGNFMPNVSKGYKNLDNAISKAKLENYILNKPTIYSEIANTIYMLKTYLTLEILSLIILVTTQVLVNIFIVISFKESNNMKDSIKRIHGYSFKDINFKFNLINLAIWILLGIILLIVEESIMILLITLIFMAIDISFSNVLLMFFDKNINKSINKNILTKE